MSNLKEDLFNNFTVLSYEMNKLFNQLLKGKTPPRMSCRQSWCPPCDVYETPRNITVCLEVPGVRRRDIEVTVKDNVLHIRGQRREAHKVIKTNYQQMEIHYGLFERILPLTENCALNKIKSVFANGFVEIIIPKKK